MIVYDDDGSVGRVFGSMLVTRQHLWVSYAPTACRETRHGLPLIGLKFALRDMADDTRNEESWQPANMGNRSDPEKDASQLGHKRPTKLARWRRRSPPFTLINYLIFIYSFEDFDLNTTLGTTLGGCGTPRTDPCIIARTCVLRIVLQT